MTKNSDNNKKGQTLVELVFILSISALLLSGLAAGTTFMLAATRFAQQRTAALQVAKRQLSELQANRFDNDWWQRINIYCQTGSCLATDCDGSNIFSCQDCFSDCSLGDTDKRAAVAIKVLRGTRTIIVLKTVITNGR